MKPLRTAVIGTGHLGRIHARLAAENENIDLVAIVETDQAARERVAEDTGSRGIADYREVAGEIEAAVVAVPTVFHHSVVKDLLQAGIHVLVEKPITTTVAEADELIDVAAANNLRLQVGHVERFNPGLRCVADDLTDIRFIQGTRASGFTFRSTDIGVVMDLMIHDIDIVLSLVDSSVAEVSAFGAAVMGDEEDIAQATLRFENGCIAQLVASRVNYEPARAMQVFSPTSFTNIDFANRQATRVSPTDSLLSGQFDIDTLTADQAAHYRDHLFEELLVKRQIDAPDANAIADEHGDFAEAIRTGRDVRVTGRDGRNALEIAERVLVAIDQHQWDGNPAGRIGPQFASPVPLRKAGSTLAPTRGTGGGLHRGSKHGLECSHGVAIL